MIMNWESTKTGRVRAICEFCDRRSKPVEPRPDGRPGWDIGLGWSIASYPAEYEHPDGSNGSLYTCAVCRRVAEERQRRGVTPLLSPTPERAAVRSLGVRESVKILTGFSDEELTELGGFAGER